jgi:hypothetical protein
MLVKYADWPNAGRERRLIGTVTAVKQHWSNNGQIMVKFDPIKYTGEGMAE